MKRRVKSKKERVNNKKVDKEERKEGKRSEKNENGMRRKTNEEVK